MITKKEMIYIRIAMGLSAILGVLAGWLVSLIWQMILMFANIKISVLVIE